MNERSLYGSVLFFKRCFLLALLNLPAVEHTGGIAVFPALVLAQKTQKKCTGNIAAVAGSPAFRRAAYAELRISNFRKARLSADDRQGAVRKSAFEGVRAGFCASAAITRRAGQYRGERDDVAGCGCAVQCGVIMKKKTGSRCVLHKGCRL